MLKPLERLSAQGRIRLRLLPVDSAGRIDPAAVARLIGPRTALVSVQWANSETGVIQPVAEIAALARGAGALCHCDAVQAAGRLAGKGGEVARLVGSLEVDAGALRRELGWRPVKSLREGLQLTADWFTGARRR